MQNQVWWYWSTRRVKPQFPGQLLRSIKLGSRWFNFHLSIAWEVHVDLRLCGQASYIEHSWSKTRAMLRFTPVALTLLGCVLVLKSLEELQLFSIESISTPSFSFLGASRWKNYLFTAPRYYPPLGTPLSQLTIQFCSSCEFFRVIIIISYRITSIISY